MARTRPSPRPLHRLAFAGCAALVQALLAAGTARADPTPEPTAEADTVVIGLEALELMRRERREQRGAPRMLPLLSTRTEHGRLWLGLTRGSDATGEKKLRLEMVWLIPLGR